MKTKTINAILCRKFDSFVASISDEATQILVKANTIITGGSIVSMFLKENVNDYDMYFRNQETALAVAKYYVAQFKTSKAGESYEVEAKLVGDRVTVSVAKSKNHSVADVPEDPNPPGSFEESLSQADELSTEQIAENKSKADNIPKYSPLFLSSNAITLTTKVQLIIRFYGDPAEIHENYDFAHCMSYWSSWDRKVTLNAQALECILSKELRYIGSKYPICSIIRTRKFLARGWTINAGQYVKMCWQVSQLDLTDIEVLKDQLVGVDSAFFNQVIWELTKKQKDNPDAPSKVDGTYLMTLVDRIF